MARKIQRVAVLGAGVMGTGIAAHLAGAGLDVMLLDIVPPKLGAEDKAKGLTENDQTFRNKFSTSALQKALKSRPPTYHDPQDATLITVGNFDDDLEKLADRDWIIEVIVENLDIKRGLFARLDEHRAAGTLITSNTSGLKIADMVEGRSDDFKKHFFVTHFFNPVRFMRLLELVAGEDTDPEVFDDMVRFGGEILGKGIVVGKDTPNFVANRIGTYGMLYLLHAMERDDFTVEEIDAVFGPPMGRPKSAVFRTGDMVGLDTLVHVADNCYDALPDDEERDTFKVPGYLTELVKRGWLGSKTGQGFYKKVGKEISALDYKTFEYKPKQSIRAASIGAVRKIDDVGERIKAFLAQDDKYAKLAWEATAKVLIYSANRMGEIADDVANIDNALKWGFAWDLGPFETWDALGVAETVARMEKDGMAVPASVKEMLAKGVTSFYGKSAAKPTHYDFATKAEAPLSRDPKHISLKALKEQDKVLEKNGGATLLDLGDGVLGVEFHTKMNAIDPDIISMLGKAIDRAETEGWTGVVVGNEDPQAFCAGANLFGVLAAVSMKKWDDLGTMIDDLHKVVARMRFSSIPVVVAPAGLALGGGAELAMAGDATRAHAETYMGLVEIGVGLIPSGGGCWALLERFCGNLPDDPGLDPLPAIKQAFTNIAMAKVSVGSDDARNLGFLRPVDQITFNRDHVLHDAKETVLGLARAGYRPPRPTMLRLPGENGATAFKWFVDGMTKGLHITEHEALIAGKLARILTGGDTTTRLKVGYEKIYELEKEAFLSLAGEKKTQERMQHMLQKGKPLRN
ncbi:MAG: 3-hydroxyacyl-CoA dehydrogenase/enoyl-CoA hydratase family protein [Deltaproteobacteria bacterium]|nr:3-hydroxyacyl-CoA dehydrogenase/enoyl-CoA hydratase family protein [Deltaproteobacteria bacterium]